MERKMAPLREHVGTIIRKLRLAAGLTQEELGKKAGMDFKLVGDYERGARNATLDTVDRLLTAMGAGDYELLRVAPNLQKPEKSPVEETLLKTFRATARQMQPVLIAVAKTIRQASGHSDRSRTSSKKGKVGR
jgi:transcriptional regulator with XRE-family HTH domain